MPAAWGSARSAFYRHEQEIEQRFLGPEAFVSVIGGQKRAVAAVRGFHEPDAGVGEDLGAGLGSHADEGVRRFANVRGRA